MNNLPPEIIDNHILPLLDGTTLTALSSVSSEFRRMIINKDELWKSICASTWPLLLPTINSFVSTFPGGYRSFFSNAFPSLHCNNNNNNNNSQFNSIDPPPIHLLYLIDMYAEGESCPRFTMSRFTEVGSDDYPDIPRPLCFYITEKTEDWMDHFQDNLRLNWIVINQTQNSARSLFSPVCKPVSIKRTCMTKEVVYEKVMPGQCKDYTEMVKCYMKVTCSLKSDHNETHFETGMEDMNGKRVLERHANMIILNAFLNGERKKF
ncbi:unnamed protein product [Vicia faba]|uniref:F-box domain-containing protein n=1 Tax=Vicia faba TaxID=3906 RepID=A0AAV1AHQ7_VICFA|nr:unnamed protein product [Vicia faba]